MIILLYITQGLAWLVLVFALLFVAGITGLLGETIQAEMLDPDPGENEIERRVKADLLVEGILQKVFPFMTMFIIVIRALLTVVR